MVRKQIAFSLILVLLNILLIKLGVRVSFLSRNEEIFIKENLLSVHK